jgi:plastocyanin
MQTHAAARLEARTTAGTGRFGWVKLMAVGGGISAIGPMIPQVAGGFEPFLAMLAAPMVVGLVLLRFARKVGVVWLGVVSLALLVMNAPFTVDALMHPESPADFVPVTMLTVGGLLAVIATVPAFRNARGRRTDSAFPRIAAAAGVAIVVLAIGGSMFASAAVTNDAPADGSTIVDMENFAFGPETITATAGEVSFYVTNNDSARHTFTVDELGVDESIAPGQSKQITFDTKAGTFRFYCKPHDPGMEGELTVQ